MSNCIFCKIVNKEIPANIVHEDEHCVVFKDIAPKAEVHLLVIPKKHIESLAHLDTEDDALISHMTFKLKAIAAAAGLKGFRTIVNTGVEGGQEVMHLHYHILGGQNLPGFGG